MSPAVITAIQSLRYRARHPRTNGEASTARRPLDPLLRQHALKRVASEPHFPQPRIAFRKASKCSSPGMAILILSGSTTSSLVITYNGLCWFPAATKDERALAVSVESDRRGFSVVYGGHIIGSKQARESEPCRVKMLEVRDRRERVCARCICLDRWDGLPNNTYSGSE